MEDTTTGQNPLSDMRVLENEIKHISEGMKRIEEMFRDQANRSQREWDNLHKELETSANIYRKELDDLREKMEIEDKAIRTEQAGIKLEFTNFRTKVLAYATAGSAVGGLIFQLITK